MFKDRWHCECLDFSFQRTEYLQSLLSATMLAFKIIKEREEAQK